MKLAPLSFALLLLAGCTASPAPQMWGAVSRVVEVGGRSYTVWWTDDRVEVVRHGWASPGEHQAIRATMIGLIAPVTGCRLYEASLQGDSGEMRGRITCPSGA